VLAIALFFALGLFPGGSLVLAVALGYGFGIILSFAVSMLSSAMPRSGGDYILVGRTIHPMVGLVSSFCFTAGVLLSIAALTLTVITSALGPSIAAMASISGSSGLQDVANSINTQHGWQFLIGAVCILFCAGISAAGWRVSLRFQNWGAAIALLGLALAGIVVLLNSGEDFVTQFNAFAGPITHQRDSYHALIAEAGRQGIATSPSFSMAQTWPIVGLVMGFCLFSWFSAYIAGEVRQASGWKASGTMVGASLINMVLVIVFVLIFFHGFGGDFMRAINGLNGTDAYPFSAPPFYVFLASVAGGSSVLAAILGLSLSVCVLVVLWINIVQPIRAIFAWAFDGVLPLKMAGVSAKSRVPVPALLATTVISLGLYAWAVFSTGFFAIYATGVVNSVVALVLLAVSAIVLPYRRPELWQGALTTRRIGGVPVTSLVGVLALAIALLLGYFFVHYPELGLADRGAGLRNVAIVIVAAIVVYLIASAARARQGMSLTKAAAEIPSE